MPNISQKGFAHFLLIFVVVIMVGALTYVAQQGNSLFTKFRKAPLTQAATAPRTPQTAITLIPLPKNLPDTSEGELNPVFSYAVGETFKLKVKIASDLYPSNKFIARLKFPADRLQVVSINAGTQPIVATGSATNVENTQMFIQKWNEKTFDNVKGLVNLNGELVNRYLQTDPSKPTALMGTVNFKVIATGSADITIGGQSVIIRSTDNQNILGTRPGINLKLMTPLQLELSKVRSVTFLEDRGFNKTYWDPDKLIRDIPKLKELGFNTVWLVQLWSAYDPQPLVSPRVYNQEAFNDLTRSLAALKANNMKAILPLNYKMGMGAVGITGRWIYRPEQYGAFEIFAKEYLTRIQDYSDNVLILLFEESLSPFDGATQQELYSTPAHAAQMRATMGSLPSRLPPDLRAKYKIGWHDYALIGLGWSHGLPWISPYPNPEFGNGAYPVGEPVSFDFISGGFYEGEDKTDAEVIAELDMKVARFKTAYPNLPLLAGEVGASSCIRGSSEQNQARVVLARVNYFMSKGSGFNIWNWSPASFDNSCPSSEDKNLSINNPDQSLKPVATELKKLLNP